MEELNLRVEGSRDRNLSERSNWRVVSWIVILYSALAVWLYWELRASGIYYGIHSFLDDPATGAKTRPKDLIDVRRLYKEAPDYANTTDAVERLYDLIHEMSLLNIYSTYFIYSDQEELKLSGWPTSNQSACGQQLHWINDKLDLFTDYRYVRGNLGREMNNFMDSFGQPESDAFRGALKSWPGSYESCAKTTLNEDKIRGRACMALMRFRAWPQQERAIPKSHINMGICLPETCDTSSFKEHRRGIQTLVTFSLPDSYKNKLQLDGIYCFPDERSPLRRIPLAGRIFLALASSWLILLVVATVIDAGDRPDDKWNGVRVRVEGGRWKRIVRRLSLIRIGRDFVCDPLSEAIAQARLRGEPVRLDMRSLDCMKIAMMIAIMLAHCVLIVVVQSRSIKGQLEMEQNGLGRMILSIGRSVDAFFMFFGLLVAYNAPRKCPIERLAQPLTWLRLNLNVLVRIWPLFLLLYCLARLVLPYAGAGPWWDYGTYEFSPRGACMRESWLKSIPHLGMWGEPRAVICLAPAWFIVGYVQLALLAPLVTYLIYKLPNQATRLLLVASLFLISALQLVLHMRQQSTLKPDAFTLCGYFLFMLLEKFEPTGTVAPIGRLGCVAFGCYIGHLLRQYELGKIKRWPRWLASRTTLTLAVALQILVFLLPTIGYFFSQHSDSSESGLNQFLAGYVISTLLWLLTTAIELICCFTIFSQTRVVTFMSAPFWRVFNKLGLSIYLIHWEVAIFGTSHNERAATYGSYEEAWRLFAYTLVTTLPLAFLVHILFEAPLTRLLRIFLGPSSVAARES